MTDCADDVITVPTRLAPPAIAENGRLAKPVYKDVEFINQRQICLRRFKSFYSGTIAVATRSGFAFRTFVASLPNLGG